jgi:NTE family protein
VAEREKDIRYSSRTRLNTDMTLQLHRAKALARKLIARAPENVRDDPDMKELEAFAQENAITVAHLIFRPTHYDSSSKDYEFSRVTMLEHWKSGMEDVRRTLHHPAWVGHKRGEYGIAVFDLGHGGPETVSETSLAVDPTAERPKRAAE